MLSEEFAKGFLDLAHGVEGDVVLLAVEALKIVLGDDDVGEAEFLGLGDALLDAVYGAHLAAEANLAAHTPTALDGRIDIRGEDGGDDGEVHRKVGDSQSAGDIDEDILLHEFEAYAFLEHGQEHVQAALVEAGSRALGRAVGCGGDEGLGLDEEGAHALDGT